MGTGKLSEEVDGPAIRKAREAADMTIDQLVVALHDREGLARHPDTIRNVELGHARPGMELFNAMCRVLDVPRESLLKEPRRGRRAI